MDFEQLAFIEKWRQHATRGTVVALDATRGHTVLTIRVGDLGPTVDLSGRDETGAVRKQRLTIGDRVFAAFRYAVTSVTPASGGIPPKAIAKGAEIEATVTAQGELTQVEINGTTVLLEGDDALASFAPGEGLRCQITDHGRAYVIPTR